MALARVDHHVAVRLIAGLFKNAEASGLTMVYYGEPQPATEPATWARLATIDFDEAPRTTSDDAQDDADVVIGVVVCAADAATVQDGGAVHRAVSRITNAMTHKTAQDGAHTLQTFDYRAVEAPYPFENRSGRAIGIMIRAAVNRSSGESLET